MNLPYTLFLVFLVELTICSPRVFKRPATLDGLPTKLLAHRGEKVLMPEHSLGAYYLAAVLEADYVEPDLVLTKDGIPVCLHNLNLGLTTNVGKLSQFADRKRNLTAPMYNKISTISDDWFVIDFTLDELRSINLKQKTVGIRPDLFDRAFTIPTFQEYLDIIKDLSAKLGMVPELKHSTFHNKVFGKNFFERTVLDILQQNGFDVRSPGGRVPARDRPMTRVALQTFEPSSARYLYKNTDFDIIYLVDADWSAFTPRGMDEVSQYATVISPWKEVFDPAGPAGYMQTSKVTVNKRRLRRLGGWIQPSDLVAQVHKRGMRMIVYTFYDSRETKGSRKEELDEFFEQGADGLFVENVAEAESIKRSYFE